MRRLFLVEKPKKERAPHLKNGLRHNNNTNAAVRTKQLVPRITTQHLVIENRLNGDLAVIESLGNWRMRRTRLLVSAREQVNIKNHARICQVAALDWLKAYCSHTRHVLMLDDDYFVQPGRLAQFIGALSENARYRLAAGYVVNNELPVRNSRNKNYVARQSYPNEVYPPYMANGAMLLSGEMAVDLAMAAHYVKLFHLDEIFLALVMDKLLLHPQHLWNFVSQPQRVKLGPILAHHKRFQHILLSHGYTQAHLTENAWKHMSAKRGYC